MTSRPRPPSAPSPSPCQLAQPSAKTSLFFATFAEATAAVPKPTGTGGSLPRWAPRDPVGVYTYSRTMELAVGIAGALAGAVIGALINHYSQRSSARQATVTTARMLLAEALGGFFETRTIGMVKAEQLRLLLTGLGIDERFFTNFATLGQELWAVSGAVAPAEKREALARQLSDAAKLVQDELARVGRVRWKRQSRRRAEGLVHVNRDPGR